MQKENLLNTSNKVIEGEKIVNPSLVDERDLADIIYIFYDKDKPGLRLIDLAPSNGVVRLTGKLPDDVIMVDATVMDVERWDDDINFPNRSVEEKYRDLSGDKKRTVTTIMVSVQKMNEILEILEKSDDLSRITINISDKKEININNQVENSEKYVNDDNFFINSYDEGGNFSK